MKLLALIATLVSSFVSSPNPIPQYSNTVYFPIQYYPTKEDSLGYELAVFPMHQYPDSLQIQLHGGYAMFTCDNGAWYLDELADVPEEHESIAYSNAAMLELELNTVLSIWASNPAVVAAYNYCQN